MPQCSAALFLIAIALLTAACGANGYQTKPRSNAHTNKPFAIESNDLQQVLKVNLEGVEEAPVSRRSLAEVKSMKERPRDETEGSPVLFFYGFDSEILMFVTARQVELPPTPRPVKRAAKWEAVERIVVARNREAVAALGLATEIGQYEEGICGITVGTDAQTLLDKFGEPDAVAYPAAAGCIQHAYGDFYVYLCFDQVRDITPPESGVCP